MKVGLIGTGKMGLAFGRRLLDAGMDLVVFNRTPQRAQPLVDAGATLAESPAEVLEQVEVVVASLVDSRAMEEVATGARGLLSSRGARGSVLCETSTVSVSSSARVAEAAERAGASYLRTPVMGNPSVVESGNLSILISGDEEALERARPALEALGPNHFHLGSGEQARVAKLALNSMLAGTTELIAESLVLGEASGIERSRMLDLMCRTVVGSPFVQYKAKALAENDYTATATTDVIAKDLALALESGADSGVPLPVTALVHELLRACSASGWGELDFASLVLRLERDAGRFSAKASEAGISAAGVAASPVGDA